MKICAISDTHRRHNDIYVPEADVLVHCGDFTNQGTTDELKSFLHWFSSLPHKHKIFICGNHELGMDQYPKNIKKKELIKKYTDNYLDFYYLENSSVIIDGVKFYGSPITPYFRNWAFNVARGPEIADKWADIPDDTNVLITHGPPYGILDEIQPSFAIDRDPHQGCKDLLSRIHNLQKLQICCFGHIHKNIDMGPININNVYHINASICNDWYKPINKPIIITI